MKVLLVNGSLASHIYTIATIQNAKPGTKTY